MTKEEVYNIIVDVQKNTGQGLSGIVKVMGDKSQYFSEHISTLVEEGLVTANDTGGSLGHPESKMFYTPSKGYNVWDEEKSNSSQNLAFVRFYLGIVEDSEEERDEDDMKRFLNPTAKERIQNLGFITRYAEWLGENEEGLIEMLNLEELVVVGVQLSDEDIEFIKERGWYKDDKPVKECVSLSKEKCDDYNAIISVQEKLLVLYEDDPTYAQSKKDAIEDIREIKEETLPQRKRVHDYLSQMDQSTPIQEQLEEIFA